MKTIQDIKRFPIRDYMAQRGITPKQGVDMGAYGIIDLPPFDSPIKLSAAQLQRRVGESPEEHLARVTALLNQVAEAMVVATEERKRKLRDIKPKKSTLKL